MDPNREIDWLPIQEIRWLPFGEIGWLPSEEISHYRDIFNKRAFELILDTDVLSGENIQATLLLNGGAVFERKFERLSCSITGTPLVKLEPCEKDLRILNQKFLQAAKTGTPEQLDELLECGADPNTFDRRNCSAIQFVCDRSCDYVAGSESPVLGPRNSLILERLIAVLGEHKADVNRSYVTNGDTPLMKLVHYGQAQGMDQLLTFKPNVNAQNFEGNTALMLAADRADPMIVRTLLRAKPNLLLKNRDGKTARDIAQKKGYEEIADLLTPVTATAKIEGRSDGTCSPAMIHLSRNETVEITLAGEGAMFMLSAPDLGLDLMSMPSRPSKRVITPTRTGTFPFTCGVHGSTQQTRGSFMVM